MALFTNRGSMNQKSKMIRFAVLLLKMFKYFIALVFGLCILAMFVFSYTKGRSPVAGDTYSSPLANIVASITLVSIGLFAWSRSKNESSSPDAFAAWLHSKTPKREEHTSEDV